ncbi:hypothetical protein BJX70DRAFT_397334 [Aspergillus crustosus]
MHWKPLPLLLPFLSTTTTALQTTRITTTFTPACPNPYSSTSHSQNQDQSQPADLDLSESFSVGLSVRSGICQGVPVPLPLGYIDEVDHVYLSVAEPAAISGSGFRSHRMLKGAWRETSLEIENAKREDGEICRARLYERPGCFGEALVEMPFYRGGIENYPLAARIHRTANEKESECVTREFVRMSEVWVKVDCGSKDEITTVGEVHGAASILVNGNGNGNGNANANANRTIAGAGKVGHRIANGTAAANTTGLVGGRWQRRRFSLLGR